MAPVVPALPTALIEVELSAHRRPVPTAAIACAADPPGAATGPLRPTGKAGEVLAVAGAEVTWTVGVGDGAPADWRAAGAALAGAVNTTLCAAHEAGRRVSRSLQVLLPGEVTGAQLAAFTVGIRLGGYRFMISAAKQPPALTTVRLVTEATADRAAAVAGAVRSSAATALARDLANAPSNIKNPPWLADTAAAVLAGMPGMRVTVRDEKWLADKGFGGTLAVGGGSATPPRLIEMAWRPRGANGPHLVLVGKGITFDTGGLSLKPPANMHWMRTDMAGGGAVIAAMRAIADARLPVKVTGLVAAAENHVSGTAYRPGDVVRHFDGTTTEVANTDAEGRMVLADAIGYAVAHHKADLIIDVATLTGAMKVALGVRTAGVFASSAELAGRLVDAGAAVGEQFWPMPLLEPDEIDVHGDLGDLKQAPGGPGGIAAAMFLREFTAGVPWLHLDIAGPARAETAYDEVPVGATGFAARTLAGFAGTLAA